MEGFKYVDIFATKGIEYIVTITFLVVLVFFWRWLNRTKVEEPKQISEDVERVPLTDWFRLATGYNYHMGHSWLHRLTNTSAQVGIDDFAQKLIGKADKLHLPKLGSTLRQGENGLQIEIDGKMIAFLSPVDGEVTAVNQEVIDAPELINQDPYGKGWLIQVNASHITRDMKNLLSGKMARAWIENTVDTLSSMINRGRGVVLQDGGTITSGFVRELEPEHWEQVAAQFFLTDDTKN